MSVELFPKLLLINEATFISEDKGFLTSFFCLQKNLPQEKLIKPWVWILIIAIIFSSLIDWLELVPGLSFVTIVISFPYILLNLYYYIYLRYTEYRLKKIFNSLCNSLRDNHHLLKKLLNLANELQIIEKKCYPTESNFNQIVKSTFDLTTKLFNILRDETKRALSLPATVDDVNREDNYISCLPNQLFEDLLKEETPTPYQLKSLIQLIRIQQSELLRRILCVHVSGTLEEKCQTLSRIVHTLEHCQDKLSPESVKLKTLFAFYYSSHFKHEQTPTRKTVDPIAFDISSGLKQIRLQLRSALLILDHVERIPPKDITENQSFITSDLKKIEKELTLSMESLKILVKKLHKENNLNSHESIQKIETPQQDNSKTIIIGEDYQPSIEDQVYEIFIDDDESLEMQYLDETEEYPMTKELAEISANLFQELKTALIPKAEETREREAKALGVSKDQVPIQLSINEAQQPKETTKSQKIPSLQSQEAYLTGSTNFSLALASQAAQISKKMKLIRQEECFGDESDNENDELVDNQSDAIITS